MEQRRQVRHCSVGDGPWVYRAMVLQARRRTIDECAPSAPTGPRDVAAGGARLRRAQPVVAVGSSSLSPRRGEGVPHVSRSASIHRVTSGASSAPLRGRCGSWALLTTGCAASPLHPRLHPCAPFGARERLSGEGIRVDGDGATYKIQLKGGRSAWCGSGCTLRRGESDSGR